MTSNSLPPQIEAILAQHEEAEHKQQRRRTEAGTKTSVRFLYEHDGDATTLHWFHSPAVFPIPTPVAGQTVRVLTEDPLMVERVELTYEVVTGTQYVTTDVYVRVPST